MEVDKTSEETIGIETKDGPVRGFIEKTDAGTYYRFKSIPYAEPPIGDLRFLAPVPTKPWSNEIDCTRDAPQPVSFCYGSGIIGSEDCLYLEVSTPNIQPAKPQAVMFWIGGYSFTWHTDTIFDHSLMLDHNVVFVTCGYRMGPLGFLSFDDFMASGNVGLKDLVLAMKWLQRNIHAFGGDPNNVTIFGSSTGGAIVHLMMLSPMTTGLFHKAIIQSVTALNNWTVTKNAPLAAYELAKELNLMETDKTKLIEQLRQVPAYDMMKAVDNLLKKKIESDIYIRDSTDAMFRPCIEQEFEGQSAFLSRSPFLIIKSGKFNKVPLIIGSSNYESSVVQLIKEDYFDYEKCNKDICLVVPKSLTLTGDVKTAESIGHRLLNFYLDGEKYLTKDTKMQYLQLISDYYFLYTVNKAVRLHKHFAAECPVYYYITNCAGQWEVPPELTFFNSLGHCVELPFLFRIKLPGHPVIKGSKDSVRTRSRLIKMWTNFAKHGNPTPDDSDPLLQITWDPVTSEQRLDYLLIGHELTKGRNPFYERMDFWDQIYNDYKFLHTAVYFNDRGVVP